MGSKQIIFNVIDLNNFVNLTPFLDLTHIHNYGISFGLFSGIISPLVLILIGLIVTFILIYMSIKTSHNLEKWSYACIIAGAISNIFDRFYNGYVIDFIYFHHNQFYWPAFNFADIYITIGIFIMVLSFLGIFKRKSMQ